MKTPAAQRGMAALAVTLLLFFALLLGTAFVNRNLVFEHRSSANQYRSTQAFEAAEAGLEWALASLNTNARVGADCKPSTDAAASAFRDRYLVYQAADRSFTPLTWRQDGVATALRPACMRAADGWACSCPLNGAPSLAMPSTDVPSPAFSVQFLAGPKAGTVRVVSNGCSRLASPCDGGGASSAEANARIEMILGLLPGLRTPPAATLTTRGDVVAGDAALGIHNADPATGVAIDAGGAVHASALRLTAPAGAPTAGSIASNDAALAALTPDRFFATYFGIDRDRWKNQPVVQRLTCASDCDMKLTAAIGADFVNRMLFVDGDLTLSGPLELGSQERPVIIATSGAITLGSGVVIHGLIYGGSLTWTAGPPDSAMLHGAAVLEGDFSANGAPDLVYDAQILAALRDNSGGFARVNGSWRDF